jgi:hypothetical protein
VLILILAAIPKKNPEKPALKAAIAAAIPIMEPCRLLSPLADS